MDGKLNCKMVQIKNVDKMKWFKTLNNAQDEVVEDKEEDKLENVEDSMEAAQGFDLNIAPAANVEYEFDLNKFLEEGEEIFLEKEIQEVVSIIIFLENIFENDS